ncbi:MFS transporter [Sphingopyxis sp. Q841]|uniref:MFS transporter n=1 Tax=Sphingopyxis sp. Q841 TaxID=3458250 RepID=UPI0040354861
MFESGRAQHEASNGAAYGALAMLTLILIVCNIDRMIIAILFDSIKAEFRLQDWQLGILSGLAFTLFYGVGSLFIARVAERRDRIAILSASLAVWSALTMACGLATSYVQLLVLRMGVGLSESGCQPASHSLISDLFDEDRRPFATGIYAAGALAGGLVALPLGGILAQHYGWRGALLIVGAPGLIIAVLVRFAMRDPRRRRGAAQAAATKPEPAAAAFRTIFSDRAMRNIILAGVLYAMASAASLSFGPAFLMRKFDISPAEAGIYFGLLSGIPAIVTNVVVGWFASRLARRDLAWLQWIAAAGALLAIPATIVFLLAPSLEIALAGLVIQSCFSVFWLGPSIAAMQSAAGAERRATAAACFVASYTVLGFGLGPVVAGAISDVLTLRLGGQGLGGGLLALQPLAVWAAAHFLLAANALRAPRAEVEK